MGWGVRAKQGPGVNTVTLVTIGHSDRRSPQLLTDPAPAIPTPRRPLAETAPPAHRAPATPSPIREPVRRFPRASIETCRNAWRYSDAPPDRGAPAPLRPDSCGCLS